MDQYRLKRLDTIAKIVKTEKVTRTQMEFVDIAGLIRGASKGEGLGNQFLANIREVNKNKYQNGKEPTRSLCCCTLCVVLKTK